MGKNLTLRVENAQFAASEGPSCGDHQPSVILSDAEGAGKLLRVTMH